VTRPGPKKNLAASVRDRLTQIARTRKEDFNFVLTRTAGANAARSAIHDQIAYRAPETPKAQVLSELGFQSKPNSPQVVQRGCAGVIRGPYHDLKEPLRAALHRAH
jgi:adenylosuccinate lyase